MKKDKGFTLLIAIITTSMLLIVSFVIANIAFKQLVLATAAKESQFAFYNADSGTECVVYWDLIDSTTSPFYPADRSSFGTFSCNGQSITPTLVSDTGGNLLSSITITFPKGCAVVRVGKKYELIAGVNTLVTTIDSRGYNTCTAGALRRYERGVTLAY